MSSCRVLLIVSSLFALCLPAVAGHYSGPVYDASGGTATVYGGYTEASGISGQGQGPASASCSGTLKATFTWVTDYPNEPPPKSVIVTRHASASASAGSSVQSSPSATCSTGLGQSATGPVITGYAYPPYGPPIPTNKSANATVSETKYEVKTGRNSLVVECGPSASAGGDRGAVTRVSFSAYVQPVVLSLSHATIGADGKANFVIGQGTTGSISAGGFQLTDYSWTLPVAKITAGLGVTYSGGNIQGGGEVDLPNDLDIQASPHWYWKKDGAETILCTADVIVNGTSIGSATAEKTVQIDAPQADVRYYTKDVKFFGYRFGLFGDVVNNVQQPGFTMEYMAVTPSQFAVGGDVGAIGILQIAGRGNNNVWRDSGGNWYRFYRAGSAGLDVPSSDYWMYGTDGYANGTWFKDEDSPNVDLAALPNVVETRQEFDADDWLMYIPPGFDCTWVPLYKFGWQYNGQASGNVGGVPVLDWTKSGSGSTKGKSWLPDYPSWTLVMRDIPGTWYPIGAP